MFFARSVPEVNLRTWACVCTGLPGLSPGKKLPPRATDPDPYKPVIDGILRADLDAPRKQRHTFTRIAIRPATHSVPGCWRYPAPLSRPHTDLEWPRAPRSGLGRARPNPGHQAENHSGKLGSREPIRSPMPRASTPPIVPRCRDSRVVTETLPSPLRPTVSSIGWLIRAVEVPGRPHLPESVRGVVGLEVEAEADRHGGSAGAAEDGEADAHLRPGLRGAGHGGARRGEQPQFLVGTGVGRGTRRSSSLARAYSAR